MLSAARVREAVGSRQPILDVISGVTAAYSTFRKLRVAYGGSAFKVRRTSDSTKTDIGYLSSGYLDTASLSTFCSGTDGYIDTWYDQSASGLNLVSGGSSHDLRIVLAGTIDTKNGHPAAIAPDSSRGYASATFGNYTGTTLCAALVATLQTATANGRWLTAMGSTADTSSGTSEGSILFYRDASGTTWATNRAAKLSNTSATPAGQLDALATVFDGTNNTLYRNATTATPVASSAAFSVHRIGIGMTTGTTYLSVSNNAYIGEAIFKVAAGAWSAADVATIRNDQKGDWGTP